MPSGDKSRVVSKVDVARVAGVSHMTVTRVLQNHPQVKPATREKVLSACAQLNYHCNLLASGLRSGKSYAIGVAVSTLDVPTFGRLVNGVEERAAERNYHILAIQTERMTAELDERKQLDGLIQRQCDGLIIDALLHKANFEYLAEQNIPIVAVDSTDDYFPYVGSDDTYGTRLATEYLIGLGHRKIAHLAGTPGSIHGDVKLETFKRVMAENKLQVSNDMIVFTNYKQENGYKATLELLDRSTEFTAIFAAGDPVATGAMLALHERGLRVPDDISVVGYCGDPSSKFSIPPLTTIYQPFEDMGRAAVDLLMAQIESSQDEQHAHILLPTTLIERASCKAVSCSYTN